MNLENICVGLIVKNYKELALLLEEPILEGNSKIKQIKEWNRFFEFKKDGYKYIIVKEYDTPMNKIDDRSKGSRSIYIKYIEAILLYLLSKQKNQTLVCTKNYLLVALGMVDRSYTDRDMKSRKSMVKDEHYNQKDIDEFDSRAFNVIHKILFSALNNLQRRFLLNWKQELHITAINQETGKPEEWVATDDELRNYTDIKLRVAQQMGKDEGKPEKYDSLRDIYFYNQTKKFYDLLRDELFDEFGWDNAFVYYRIIYKTENVIDAIPRTERQLEQMELSELNKNKKDLNDKVVTALNNNAETKYKHMIEKFRTQYDSLCLECDNNNTVAPSEYDSKIYKPKDNYVDIQKKIAEKLVKLQC